MSGVREAVRFGYEQLGVFAFGVGLLAAGTGAKENEIFGLDCFIQRDGSARVGNEEALFVALEVFEFFGDLGHLEVEQILSVLHFGVAITAVAVEE